MCLCLDLSYGPLNMLAPFTTTQYVLTTYLQHLKYNQYKMHENIQTTCYIHTIHTNVSIYIIYLYIYMYTTNNCVH